MKSGGARDFAHGARGCAEWLKKNGISFETLDYLYEECEDFDLHAARAAETVVAASREENIVYGVFDVRDRSASEILKRTRARVVAGPPAEGALTVYAQDAVKTLVAADWENFHLNASEGVLIRELDSRALASEVKLKLMDCYPEEEIAFVRLPDGGIAKTELYNLDRLSKYDHRTSAYIPSEGDLTKLERYDFADLQTILSRLCAPDGCRGIVSRRIGRCGRIWSRKRMKLWMRLTRTSRFTLRMSWAICFCRSRFMRKLRNAIPNSI